MVLKDIYWFKSATFMKSFLLQKKTTKESPGVHYHGIATEVYVNQLIWAILKFKPLHHQYIIQSS